ncbi:excinuclease ABC subunit UvrA [Bernardetia sp. ABR2-2B]|uniref:excinuclease ABC subunit UvrA n=1 Tax=Bernardetia sp. ABR2-2B TaxID=3127472 RepID=UPI0030D006DA
MPTTTEKSLTKEEIAAKEAEEKRVNELENYDTKKNIVIKGARVNNLKNISLAVPRNKLIVITGVSGSGKSSLAFDTLFAEGQRMYVESLSSYARQFLGRMEKPDVDWIRGVSPAIAVEQKVNTRNPRSTVGTTTEIYDYLKLLFSRIGVTYSPVSGEMVKKDNVSDVVDFIESFEESSKYMVLAPLVVPAERTLEDQLNILLQQGFTRIKAGEDVIFIEQLLPKEIDPEAQSGKDQTEQNLESFLDEHKGDKQKDYEEEKKKLKKASKTKKTTAKKSKAPVSKLTKEQTAELKRISKLDLFILIDRGVVRKDDEQNRFRIADSVQTSFYESKGDCVVEIYQKGKDMETRSFSDRFEADGMLFEEPNINFFSFNSPYGACRTCEGFGTVLGIDEDLIIPDKTMSVYEGAIAPWRTPKMSKWLNPLIKKGIDFDFPIHRAYQDLTEQQQQLLWTGNKYFKGLDEFFAFMESESYKIQYRVLLSKYRGRKTCPDCIGTRIRKEAGYVKIDSKSIQELVLLPLDELIDFFAQLQLTEHQESVSKRILIEIRNRLQYLGEVGLQYLTLNRKTATLSGGEFQRIKLATSLGSALVGSMYILDEPSIGLHPRDTQNLIKVLKKLRDLGNTVIVVEHEEEVMKAADQIIDIGLDAGANGGNLTFQGTLEELIKDSDSYTAKYLRDEMQVIIPQKPRNWNEYIEVVGAREHNLKNISVKFPLGILTTVTGVSGSGKSTLVRKLLYPALSKHLGNHNDESGKMDKLAGNLKKVTSVEMVDQNPIGKSSRSNPVTYVKAYDYIRALFADQTISKQRGFTPAYFSFNVEGGRCENCQGEGKIKIEMQFMADIYLTCEACKGKRFQSEVLEVEYKEKNIADVLDMTVDEAIEIFAESKPIMARLKPLQEVGLGYIQLGQSSNTLSGGEAQRVKLAAFLTKSASDRANREHILFIFDEPTTGLHFHDISKLLKSINALIEHGHSAIIIEHNVEVIRAADWVIDLGKEGGKNGGYLCFEGTPKELSELKENYTGEFL